MKIVRVFAILSALIVIISVLHATTVLAESITENCPDGGGQCYKSWISRCDSIGTCINVIINFIATYVLIPVGVVMVFWSGVLFATAGGSPPKIQRAKSMLLWAIIGLAFAFGAVAFGRALVNFFKNL